MAEALKAVQAPPAEARPAAAQGVDKGKKKLASISFRTHSPRTHIDILHPPLPPEPHAGNIRGHIATLKRAPFRPSSAARAQAKPRSKRD
eukprot:COSAG06_NODE_855_length_11931_cov_20.218813_8_plen_90_part_00